MAKPARHLVMQMQFFCVYILYEESISKEMNNDHNDLNLHSMTNCRAGFATVKDGILCDIRKLINKTQGNHSCEGVFVIKHTCIFTKLWP